MTPLERIAHDIICICKYGSTGGSASAAELRLVTNYLSRLGQLPSEPAPPPRVVLVAPKVVVPQLKVPTVLPTIKLPGAP